MKIIDVQQLPKAVLARAVVEGESRDYTVVFLYTREEYELHNGGKAHRWNCRMTDATYKDASGNRRRLPYTARHLRHQLFFVPHQIVQADLTRDGVIY